MSSCHQFKFVADITVATPKNVYHAQVRGELRTAPKGWFLVPVGPLITQQREYAALHKAAASEVGWRFALHSAPTSLVISITPVGPTL